MTDRVNQNQTSESIDRSIRIRARETKIKQTNQEFQEKLETGKQLGSNARAQEISREVLEQYARGEESSAKAPTGENKVATPKKTASQEKSKKTEQKKTQKDSEKDKQVSKKNEKVALDLAVQRKNQQKKDSGEFGGSLQGDFFQQAVSMGMATKKAEAIPTGPAKIPDEVLNQIVDQVYAGIDAKGVSQFVIDLKPGVLGGGRIQISANGKAVKLKFTAMDAASRAQVKSAQRELEERLDAKGLKLENFEVL